MFVRNLLRAGDFVTLVPIGIPVTLQYSEKSMLERVYQGHGDDKKNVSDDLLSALIDADTVPHRIPVSGGTTWIRGVLYTSDVFTSRGELPQSVYGDMLSAYKSDPKKFSFYAGNVESLATVFRGAAPIRQWLSMAKFKVLPGFLAPAGLDKVDFLRMCKSCNFNLRYPLVASYIIYRGSEVLYESTDLHQFVVSRVVKFVDTNGHIKAYLHFSNTERPQVIRYGDVIKHNIHPNTLIVMDKYNNIVYAKQTDDKSRDKRSDKLTCTFCGCVFTAPTDDDIMCPDEHCTSKMYSLVGQFLKTLKLPEMTYNRFLETVQKRTVTCVPDVLLLDEYKELEITTTLATLLQAIVPITVVGSSNLITLLTNKCNNSVSTLRYYLTHPNKIVKDLNIVSPKLRSLVAWLEDPSNVGDIEALLEYPKMTIGGIDKKFDGAPIFRNKTIMITGKFNHGDYSEITAILQSYAATVTTEFSSKVDCLLVGDIAENVNGSAIMKSRNQNIPIMQESEFFSRYDMDSDLVENL